MGVLLTLIAGLVVWIVLWALGTKGFDAFMITVVMVRRRRRHAHRLAAAPGQPQRAATSSSPGAVDSVNRVAPRTARCAANPLSAAIAASLLPAFERACVESPPNYDS